MELPLFRLLVAACRFLYLDSLQLLDALISIVDVFAPLLTEDKLISVLFLCRHTFGNLRSDVVSLLELCFALEDGFALLLNESVFFVLFHNSLILSYTFY